MRLFTSGLLWHLPRDKLGAVDELGEIGVWLVEHGQTRQRPLLRIHLPTDLHVDNFHFLTVLQSLTGETMGQLVCAITEIKYHLCMKDMKGYIYVVQVTSTTSKPTPLWLFKEVEFRFLTAM